MVTNIEYSFLLLFDCVRFIGTTTTIRQFQRRKKCKNIHGSTSHCSLLLFLSTCNDSSLSFLQVRTYSHSSTTKTLLLVVIFR